MDKEGITIRRMTEADLPQIKRIDELLVGEERVASWPAAAEKLWAVYRPLLSFVAESKGGVVGFILGDIRGVEYGTSMSGWIDMMGVNPAYQRQGIGQRLVEAFCKECQRNEVKIRVMLKEDDERLKAFWSYVGFHKGDLINFER